MSRVTRVFRSESLKRFKSQIERIKSEPTYRQDDGAQEFVGEIESVIGVLVDEKSSDEQILKAADYVGLASWLRYL